MIGKIKLTTGDFIPSLTEANYQLILNDIATKDSSIYEELVKVIFDSSLALSEKAVEALKPYKILKEDGKTLNKTIQDLVISMFNNDIL